MATLSKIKLRFIVQWADESGKRMTLPLGRMDKRSAETVRLHVTRIVSSRLANSLPPDDTLRWLRNLPDALYGKMAEKGLTKQRTIGLRQLSSMLAAYIQRRNDVKAGTTVNYKRAEKFLLQFFGADRDITTITQAEADDYKRSIAKQFSVATVAGMIKRTKQIFRDATRRQIIEASPFDGMKAGNQSNPENLEYVPAETIHELIKHCPTPEWKALFAMARFAGLRIKSEIVGLKWDAINWRTERMTIRSPKTEHHAGKESRIVPILPELKDILLPYFHQSSKDGYVFPRLRHKTLNSLGRKIVSGAGIVVWKKLFQNLRSSFETDLVDRFPIHVACAWTGNSIQVAQKHYLQIREDHFDSARSAAQSAADRRGTGRTAADKNTDFSGKTAFLNRGASNELTPRGSDRFPNLLGNLKISERVLHHALQVTKSELARHDKSSLNNLKDAIEMARRRRGRR